MKDEAVVETTSLHRRAYIETENRRGALAAPFSESENQYFNAGKCHEIHDPRESREEPSGGQYRCTNSSVRGRQQLPY